MAKNQVAAKKENNTLKPNFQEKKVSFFGKKSKKSKLNDKAWKERMLKVNGKELKLKYKSLQEGTNGTHEYSFEPKAIELEKGLGYLSYVDEEEFFRIEGETYES